MTDKRLNALCLLSIDSDVSRELNVDDLINEFSYKKSLKETIWLIESVDWQSLTMTKGLY